MQKEIIQLSDIASTNDYLMALSTPAPDAMTIAVASHQTAGVVRATTSGRVRMARTFYSPYSPLL